MLNTLPVGFTYICSDTNLTLMLSFNFAVIQSRELSIGLLLFLTTGMQMSSAFSDMCSLIFLKQCVLIVEHLFLVNPLVFRSH